MYGWMEKERKEGKEREKHTGREREKGENAADRN